jgi:2-amino-4-hydroxy-6-hydroxymethyldihydropteridine diphosphokinase
MIIFHVRFEDWEPIYLDILEDFGFSRGRDEEAAFLLSELLLANGSSELEALLERLEEKICSREVIICGNAPSLSSELAELLSGVCSFQAGGRGHWTFIAADGATTALLKAGVLPDVIVTDLDGKVEDIILAGKMGSIVVVHAHGDNIDKIREYMPYLGTVVGTSQSRPVGLVRNFGGFTDGDRCVFLAEHFGALCLTLIGFDFRDQSVTPRKAKKLQWAERLVRLALPLGSDCKG